MYRNRPSDNGDSLIRMDRITKIFHTPAGDFTALLDVDAQFHNGEFVSVVGKSGSGKSTLVNMITGIDRPTAGTVKVDGVDLGALSESEMSRWRGRNLGIVFQFYQLLPMLSLLENVMLPMDFAEVVPPDERQDRAMALLDKVGLAGDAHKMPNAVSGGQQQRAAVARALANDPPVLIADEPTGNLDTRSADQVFQIFEDFADRGKTVLMVTHDNELAARASRTLLLSDGEIIDETVAQTLKALSHRQMLQVTKSLQPKCFGPGELIIRQGEPNDQFYLIKEGEVDIVLRREDGTEETITRIGPGNYFGEVDLLLRERAIATVKAAFHAQVEVLALGRSLFEELMEEANALRETITTVVQERLAENASHGGPGRRLQDAAHA